MVLKIVRRICNMRFLNKKIVPLVAIILNWLAIRAIGKDEVLVKAYDRLR